MEGGDACCAMLPAANAEAAKSTTKSGTGTVSTNVADYNTRDLQKAFANASVTTSIQLELLANRKTVLGANHADHDKLGMTEEELAAAHAVFDAKRRTPFNRTVVQGLYDAVYSSASETPATTKLRSILKTPEFNKILKGEKLTTESVWAARKRLAHYHLMDQCIIYIYLLFLPAPPTSFLHAFNFCVFLSSLSMSAPLCAIYLEGYYSLLLSFLRIIGLHLSVVMLYYCMLFTGTGTAGAMAVPKPPPPT